jgi:hypothetical protein
MSNIKKQTEPITINSTVDSLLQQLHTTYTTATAELADERDKLEEESQGIQAAANELKLLLPAKAREAERAADVLLLAGKPAEAQAKRKEQQQAERAPAEMEQRCRTIAARIDQIASMKEAIARRCFAEWYPRLRAALVAEQLAMCDALDSSWTGIVRFAGAHGLAGQPGGIITASMRLVDWFGGRRR